MNSRILLVEDDAGTLASLYIYFESLGYLVDAVPSKDLAKRLMDTDPHDLLLTDLNLDAGGPAGGLDLIAHARATAPSMRVIVLTAHDDLRALVMAAPYGADAFLAKPMRLQTLLAEVRRVLAKNPAAP